MEDGVEHKVAFTDEQPLLDKHFDDSSTVMDVADVGCIVELPDLKSLAPDAHPHLSMLGFRMNVQEHPAWPQGTVKSSQSVNDTLTRYSSQRPGENSRVEGCRREDHPRTVADPERHARFECVRCHMNSALDRFCVGIDRQD